MVQKEKLEKTVQDKLQRLLGHSTLDVTLNYVNLYSEDLKEGFDKHSVLSNYTSNPRMKRGKR